MSSKTSSKSVGKIMGDIIIVPFLQLEPERIIFSSKTKSNPNNKTTQMLYDGKYKLYVSMDPLVSPFGINAKTEITDSKSKKQTESPLVTGYGIELSLPKDYLEPGTLGNKYYLKAKQLNKYIMSQGIINRTEWFDIPSGRNIEGVTEQIEGVGETNYNSLMKSLLNYSRQKMKNSKGVQEIMSEYPPRFKFALDARMGDKAEGANRTAEFVTQFFDVENNETKNVTHLNYTEALPKFSEVKTLSYWQGVTSCKSWAIVKIILVQVVVKPYQKLSRDTNFLCSDSDSDSDEEENVSSRIRGKHGSAAVNYLMDDEEEGDIEEVIPKSVIKSKLKDLSLKDDSVKAKTKLSDKKLKDEDKDKADSDAESIVSAKKDDSDEDNIENFLVSDKEKEVTKSSKRTVGLKKTTI